MKIGILGGSFNPIHLGHVEIAERVLRRCDLDEIWLVPTAQNPFKDKYEVSLSDRCAMIRTTIAYKSKLKCCDVEREFDDSKQHYTYEMLKKLPEGNEYYLIIGYDNWGKFPQWYRSKDILKEFKLIVVSRDDTSQVKIECENVEFVDLGKFPHAEASSTEIRKAISEGRVPQHINTIVEFIIREKHFYKKVLT